MIDGDKLSTAKERNVAIEDVINFLKCVWDSGAVNSKCQLQLIVTKVDKLQDVAAKKAISEMQVTIQRRLETRFPNRSFLEVAARPKNGGNIRTAHGVEALLETWLVTSSNPPIESAPPTVVPGERESEAFLRRHFTPDS